MYIYVPRLETQVGGGMKGWLIRAKQPRSERISCTGQLLNGAVVGCKIPRKENSPIC